MTRSESESGIGCADVSENHAVARPSPVRASQGRPFSVCWPGGKSSTEEDWIQPRIRFVPSIPS